METWYVHDAASVRMTSPLGLASWVEEMANATCPSLCEFASPRCHGNVQGHVEPENSLGQTMHPNLMNHRTLVVLQVPLKKLKLLLPGCWTDVFLLVVPVLLCGLAF